MTKPASPPEREPLAKRARNALAKRGYARKDLASVALYAGPNGGPLQVGSRENVAKRFERFDSAIAFLLRREVVPPGHVAIVHGGKDARRIDVVRVEAPSADDEPESP